MYGQTFGQAPYDYSLGVASPVEQGVQGYQLGLGVKQAQDAQAQAEAQRQAQLQMQSDIGAVLGNRNAGGSEYAALTLKYPQLKDQVKQAWGMVDDAQKKATLDLTGQAYAAIQAGRSDIAQQILNDHADALESSGASKKDIEATRMWANLIKESPDHARNTAGLLLSSVLGADKFAETFGKLGSERRAEEVQPAAVKEANAKAESAAVAAKFAESNAVLDVQKKGWDIKKLQEDIDIAKQNTRIAAMNAQTSRINSDTQRQELQLKIQDAQQKRDELIRSKVADAEQGASTIDNMLNTIERIKGARGLSSVTGPIQGQSYFPSTQMAAITPGTSMEDAADAKALIETLGSQAFLSQASNLKGMGALSNAEGEKLQSALTSFKREQSDEGFRRNLDEAMRLLKKGRENLSRRTGVPLAAPDTPAAPGARPPLSSFGGG